MRMRSLGPLVLVVATLGAPRHASADETEGYPVEIILGVGALNAGLVLTDLAAVANQARLPRVYGGFETVFAGTEVAYCLDTLLWNHPNGGFGTMLEIGTGIGAILMAHGIVTLVAPRSHAESPGAPSSVTVAPLALSDVTRVSRPGLAVLGRF